MLPNWGSGYARGIPKLVHHMRTKSESGRVIFFCQTVLLARKKKLGMCNRSCKLLFLCILGMLLMLSAFWVALSHAAPAKWPRALWSRRVAHLESFLVSKKGEEHCATGADLGYLPSTDRMATIYEPRVGMFMHAIQPSIEWQSTTTLAVPRRTGTYLLADRIVCSFFTVDGTRVQNLTLSGIDAQCIQLAARGH